MLFPMLGPSNLPVLVAQLDERHANRTVSVLEWYDKHKALYILYTVATYTMNAVIDHMM